MFKMTKGFAVIMAIFMVLGTLTPASAVVTLDGAAKQEKNMMVEASLWHETQDKPSMGGIAMDNNSKVMYIPERNVLQIATNPVNLSGFISGLTELQYFNKKEGKYVDSTVLKKATIKTGTKHDGKVHDVDYISLCEISIPDDLKKTGVEFIKIKTAVPYTPMDAVFVDGMIGSRLRLDWSKAKETGEKELVPNNKISQGKVKPLNLMDSNVGIKIEANTFKLPEKSKLVVKRMTDGDDFKRAKSLLLKEDPNFKLYDIQVLDGDNKVNPNGKVKVVLPYAGDDIKVYKTDEKGALTEVAGAISDEDFTLRTDKLGLVAIVNGKKMMAENEDKAETEKKVMIESSDTNPALKTNFADINKHWAKAYIENAVAQKMFNGTTETQFSPNAKMTNAMVVTVLYRMAGSPKVGKIYKAPGGKAGSWYEKPYSWAKGNGILDGIRYGDVFMIKDNVTREGLATMIYRYNALSNRNQELGEISHYDDYDTISSWAVDALSWANKKGIVNGRSDKEIAPKGEATRAEVATMLWRFKEAK